MTDNAEIGHLRIALIAIGVIFILGIFALMNVWPAGWTWEPRQHEYEQMIMGVYATLGVFLLIASRDPLAHLSLIRFTIWSSIVHAAIMAIQAVVDPTERANLIGDVPALFLVAIVLAVLTHRAGRSVEPAT